MENNYLFVDEAREKAELLKKVQNGTATEKELRRLDELSKLDLERNNEIISVCSKGVSSQAYQALASQAEYAKSGYEQYITYNLKLKELYPNDYKAVENILIGKDSNSVEFEKIAINLAKERNISLEEAKSFLNKVYVYKAFADVVGTVRAGTSVNYTKSKFPAGANANEKLPIVGETKGYDTVRVTINNENVWSSTKKLTAKENAINHWDKHKNEFPELKDINDYLEKVHSFVKHPPTDTLIKSRANGDRLYYHEESNTFVVTNKEGQPKTMFRPINKKEYFDVQK